MACLFLGNLLNYVGIVSGVATAAVFVESLHSGLDPANMLPLTAVYGIGGWALMALAAAVLLRMEGKLQAKSLPTIIGFPLFVLSWTIVNAYASLTRPPRWKVIRHTSSVS